MLELTDQAGELVERSIREAQRLAGGCAPARSRAGRAGQAAADPAARDVVELAERVVEQIQKEGRGGADHRAARLDLRPGRPADPQGQARQAQRVRVRDADLRSDREHPTRRARAVIPASTGSGNPAEDALLPDTVAQLDRLGITPREVALDGGFNVGPTTQTLEGR